MEGVGELSHRWRYLVVAVEVLVAVGCLYFGWKVVSPRPSGSQVQISRAPSGPPEPALGLALPSRPPAGSTGRREAPRAVAAPGLASNGLSRLNHDDFELYRRQWQVLQLLMDGVRTYLEQRVVPQLLSQ